MSTVEELEAQMAAMEMEVAKQGDTVRAVKSRIKEEGLDKQLAAPEVEKLKTLKLALQELSKQHTDLCATTGGGTQNKEQFRKVLSSTLEHNLFYMPSFKIYGGVAGLYDYGPTGAAIKANLQHFWRQHFVLEDNMLEIECPSVTPYPVLKASGHVDRFIDLMVKDVKTHACYRADHLLEEAVEKAIAEAKTMEEKKVHELVAAHIDEYKAEALGDKLREYAIKAPETGNELTDPFPFNLMFATSIGPSGTQQGFLRPETAQGIFVNFRDLLYFNGGKLPFAAAQIGQSFRNEISPKAGLLRVREFTQMEIEHFVDPENKAHPKFASLAHLTFLMYPRAQQETASGAMEVNVGQAVADGIIANETLAYFIARTYQYMIGVGILHAKLRFRQHMANEMAHYAQDCWDAEVETTYGWVECVGLADRSAFDLDAHTKATNVDLNAFVKYDKPIEKEVLQVTPVMKELGKAFKKEGTVIKEALLALEDSQKLAMQAAHAEGSAAPLVTCAGTFEITPEQVTIAKKMSKVTGRSFTPGVIEPSFGIGRIIYCMYEHAFYTRENDDQRVVFRFTPLAAPVKCSVFALMAQPIFQPAVQKVAQALTRAGISRKVDDSGASIGKRYARTDEIGVPFAITVDHTTLEDDTVTLRERDSMLQVRIPAAEVPKVVKDLCDMVITWEADVYPKFPHQEVADDK